MTSKPVFPAALVAAAMAPCLASAAFAQPGPTGGPGMTYESLGDLPDFGGSWLPTTGPFASEGSRPRQVPQPTELRPEAAAQAAAFARQVQSGAAVDRGYCVPPAFGGRLPIMAAGALEILYTPGRVTIATEGGVVRRIYLRDTPPPGALEESRGGTSIGRWENGTLVVETTGLMPTARFLQGVPIGRGVEVTERIFLADTDTLVIETTTVAPDVLTAPLRSTNRYRRDRERFFTEFDTCVAGDRSFDDASQQERFDVTPPSDLPPPPES
ncbi:MAG: hypothetical protein JW741_05495 [Sedimentisphaerales bacterium]|nr:hypothetical protein [Sedimentisphaerales bacterium]